RTGRERCDPDQPLDDRGIHRHIQIFAHGAALFDNLQKIHGPPPPPCDTSRTLSVSIAYSNTHLPRGATRNAANAPHPMVLIPVPAAPQEAPAGPHASVKHSVGDMAYSATVLRGACASR